jgi:predicted ATPase
MYDQLVTEGKVNSDEHQRNIIAQLQRIWLELKSYQPEAKIESINEVQDQPKGWMSKVGNSSVLEIHYLVR